MMYFFERLLFALFFAVVTTYLLYLLYSRSHFLGFIAKEISRSRLLKLRGQYVASFERNQGENIFQYEIIEVKNVFSLIWGTMQCIDSYDDLPNYRRKYKFYGSIRREIVIGTYQFSDYRSIDMGSFTMKIKDIYGENVIFEGCYAWVDIYSNVPESGYYVWEKINSIRIRKSNIHGFGLFADKNYEKGDVIARFKGVKTGLQSRYSFFIDGDHAEPTGVFRFINHSCEANCVIKNDQLYANEQIKKDVELCVNYVDTESELKSKFDCNCGSVGHLF